jgi:hypothetical protein
MTKTNRPLRLRENILIYDVAEAIAQIVGYDNHRLSRISERVENEPILEAPIALTKTDVIKKLVILSHRNDDDTVADISAIAARSMTDQFRNKIVNTWSFQTGCQKYEQWSKYPVVMVSEFFFKEVLNGGDLSQVLDSMSDAEVTTSLPGRPRKIERIDEEGRRVVITDEKGKTVEFGKIAGAVVFPQNASSNLLRKWLEVRAAVAAGILEGAVSRIENARPDSLSVERMREHVNPLPNMMRRALPRHQ